MYVKEEVGGFELVAETELEKTWLRFNLDEKELWQVCSLPVDGSYALFIKPNPPTKRRKK